MVYPKNGWLGMVAQIAVTAFVAAIVAMGCASTQTPTSGRVDSMIQSIGDVSVARDGDDAVILAALVARDGHAKRRGNGRGGVARAESVVGALAALEEAGDTLVLANRGELLAAAG